MVKKKPDSSNKGGLSASGHLSSIECPAYICNTKKVTNALGYWPSFHDAEVISFSAARAAPGQLGKTSAHLCVNVCQYREVGGRHRRLRNSLL